MASPPKAFNPPPNFLFTKEEYGKKLTNLEYRIQRIKKRNERKSMSLLMAEIIDNAQEKKPQPSSSPEDLILPPDGQYICDECNSNERTPYQLCEHKAIYHSSSDQRAWKCVYCKTKFGRRGGLRRHVQMVHMQMMHKCPIKSCTHPGYKCTKVGICTGSAISRNCDISKPEISKPR
uniref:C2H2-type domain-containing protein n=1 Tax=Caenorhabditis japonica TaxID=281687 RepID=A0A8R1I810_CAEJA